MKLNLCIRPLERSGAERAVLPLRVKADFCDLRSPLRSRSTTYRSARRSARFFRLPLTAPLHLSDFLARSTPFSAPLQCSALHVGSRVAHRAVPRIDTDANCLHSKNFRLLLWIDCSRSSPQHKRSTEGATKCSAAKLRWVHQWQCLPVTGFHFWVFKSS